MIKIAAIGGSILLALFLAVSIGLFVTLKSTQKQLVALEVDRDRLESAIEAHKLVEAGQKEAIVELERETKDAKSREEMLELILTEIRNAPKADNGEIAKVLERALRHVDSSRLRKRPAPDRAPRPLRH